jgi:hypothetical protein
MGEKQIRALADKVGADALRPMFDALADLAVAVDAASRRDEVRAQARERAERLMADAEAEIGRRDQRWRDAWQAEPRASPGTEASRRPASGVMSTR